jgi:cell division septation protein DedD
VTDNQEASSLAAARKVVPDAYLSSGNKLIYLGALNSKEEAQQRLKQLQAKGIKARVQQP